MAGITQDLSLSQLSAWLTISGPIFPVWEAFLFLDLKLDPRRLSIANNPSSWKHFLRSRCVCQIVGIWSIVQRKEAFRLPCYVCVWGNK